MTDVPPTRWARTVDGAFIAYQDLGEGPVTLLVVHGWVSHLEVYWEQPRYVRFLKRLARNMRVLVFDKRGIGMSDRVQGAPDLDALLDDVRAVMDDAGVERAAILSWGAPGPQLGLCFAATFPERTLCLVLDGWVHMRKEPDYPFGLDEQEFERWTECLAAVWGRDDAIDPFLDWGYGDQPGDCPREDEEFRRWNAKLARFAATPASYAAFVRMWFDTDVRRVLSSTHVPTAILRFAIEPDWEARAIGWLAAGIPASSVLDVPGRDLIIWLPEPEPLVSAIESYIETVRHEEAVLDRMLATVLFTDVVGSTERACREGDARWAELLEKHNTTVRALLARYRGNEVKTTGDGFLATFDGPARAVKCAQAVCRAVRPLGLEVRAGCHTGEIELLGVDVGGVAVHIGARVGALAGPSEVLVTSTVKDLVAGSGLAFDDRGEHRLKGVPEPWRLYAVTPSDLS